MKNCVYRIINTINNKVYIGSTIDAERRKLEHFSQLEGNRHINTHLQNAYNRYGKDVFIFDVIESSLNSNDLIKREQHYINLFNSSNINFGYNISSFASQPDSRKYTKTYVIKLRDILQNKNLSTGAITLMTHLQLYLENYTNRVVMEKGRNIANADLVNILNISRQHIHTLLNELEDNGIIKKIGNGKSRKIYFNPYISTTGTEIQQETYELFKGE